MLTLSGFAKPLPRIIVGTAGLGSVLPHALVSNAARDRAFRYLDGLLEIGCSALDTAASYQLGGTERLLGSWVKSRRNQDRLFLISKGAHPYPIVRPNRLGARAITRDLEASLKRLQVEQLDLYLLHKDHPHAPLDHILETMSGFQRQGKIAAWGVSNWSHIRIRALEELARKTGMPSIAASSPHFSLAEWVEMPWSGSVSITGEANREERAFYESRRLPVLAWSPLGRGFFASATPSNPDWLGPHPLKTYGSAANIARRQRAEELARKHGVSPAQIALAYLFNQKFPVFAVVSARTVEKMRSNVEATSIRLSESEVRWLESAGANPN